MDHKSRIACLKNCSDYGCALLLLLSLACTSRGQSPTADPFNPGAAAPVRAVAVQADGKIILLDGDIRRVNRDGSLDLGFTPPAADVSCLAVQPDGKIVAGGLFGGNIGRLNPDGTLDASFYPQAAADDRVNCIVIQPDGKIVVGGYFSTLNDEDHECIGRLNADGTVDSSFQASAASGFFRPTVSSLALQPDGKILVAGLFTVLNGEFQTGIGRLNPDGTLDEDFLAVNVGQQIECATLQADGKILVAGNGLSLRRTDTYGILDSSFSPVVSGAVPHGSSIAIQADEKILLGGDFDAVNTQSRTNLVRLNSDGTVDPDFDAGTDGWALCVAVQPDGELVAGGQFGVLAGENRTNIGRLNATESATQSLTFNGSSITWMRGGTSPEVWRTTFDYLNGGSWAPLGAGARVPGGWELDGLSLPTTATIRARGYVSTGGKGDSFVETVLNPALVIAEAHLSGGEFAFDILGPAGQAVVVEASTNLGGWAPLQTATLGVGPFTFKDPQTPSFPKRFYRVRVGP